MPLDFFRHFKIDLDSGINTVYGVVGPVLQWISNLKPFSYMNLTTIWREISLSRTNRILFLDIYTTRPIAWDSFHCRLMSCGVWKTLPLKCFRQIWVPWAIRNHSRMELFRLETNTVWLQFVYLQTWTYFEWTECNKGHLALLIAGI